MRNIDEVRLLFMRNFVLLSKFLDNSFSYTMTRDSPMENNFFETF